MKDYRKGGYRDYKKEYKDYYGVLGKLTPLQRLHRKHKTSRNAARRKLRQAGRHVRGKDVDHINKNPLDNRMTNLRVRSIKKNRANKS